MSEHEAKEATREELAKNARLYYEAISCAALDWLSTIPHAIDAWEREPILLQRIIDAEDRIIYLEEELSE